MIQFCTAEIKLLKSNIFKQNRFEVNQQDTLVKSPPLKLTTVVVMAEEEEVDLFQEKKEKEKSRALAEEKRLKQHIPIANQLFDEKEERNKILKEKELKKPPML